MKTNHIFVNLLFKNFTFSFVQGILLFVNDKPHRFFKLAKFKSNIFYMHQAKKYVSIN